MSRLLAAIGTRALSAATELGGMVIMLLHIFRGPEWAPEGLMNIFHGPEWAHDGLLKFSAAQSGPARAR